MALDSVFSTVTDWGSCAWVYGTKDDLWETAAASCTKNFNQLKKPYLITVIDYSLNRNTRRLGTLNVLAPAPTLMFHALVAHGKDDTGKTEPAPISRRRGSNCSCVGGFVTKHIYQSGLGQKDKSKQRPALVLEGLDASNDNARNRGIRMHGAHYVRDSGVGCSHGCICCKQDVHEDLIKLIQEGSFIFAYAGPKHVDL